MSKDNKNTHKSKIGGQALFEGVMMRGSGKEAMAVRKKDGSIHVETKDVPANKWYQKTPFVRGVFNFILQMKNGYGYMMKSMEISGFLDEEKEETPDTSQPNDVDIIPCNSTLHSSHSALNSPLQSKKESKALESFIGVVGLIGGFAIAIFLFMFVPAWGFGLFDKFFEVGDRFQPIFEGIIRIILFVAYMWAVSLMKDIRKTYEYHGAEHMTIAAYEAGEKLDPDNIENIKKFKRFHPRCGTSFIFLMLVISILFYSVLQVVFPVTSKDIASWDWVNGSMILANIIRTGVKLLCLPFLVGISYEVIKLAGRYDRNIIMRAVSAPGLAMQRLTTKIPNDSQLQVAVAAMIPVIPENKDEDKW